jgi:hypothetical protein
MSEADDISHLLDGCRAKLARAQETLNVLENEVAAYLSQDSPLHRIEKKHLPDGLEYAFIAYGEAKPPLRFAVISGEVVHHLRSSLDHLVHALVIRNGEKPTRQHQFPLCASKKEFKEACGRGQIKGVGVSARKLIESVQPYASPTPDDTILYVISQYDNADKHRLLVVVTAVAYLGESITIGVDNEIAEAQHRKGRMPNIIGFGEMGPKKLSVDGTVVFSIKLAEPAPELTADATLNLQLALDQCGRVKCAPLIDTLRHLFEGTRHTIELFAKEF